MICLGTIALSPPDVLLVLGVLIMALSVPLILRMVPMNGFYGVRIRKACASEHNWYALNAFGGVLFLVYGAVLAIAGIIGRALSLPPTSAWAPLLLAGPLLGIMPVILLVIAYAKRLEG